MESYSILVSLIIALLAATTANAKYSGGTGDPNDPYKIATAEDLNDIGRYEEDWGKHFILINDVNLAGYTGSQFKVIGRFAGWSPTDKPFTGVFDGNDHKVRNFTWSSIDSNGIGLFGYLGEGGQIKNLAMENVDVNAATGWFVGGLVVNNSGTITNCYLKGNIDGNDLVGSLVGLNYGTIIDCCSTGSVSGKTCVGGLAGFNGGTITDCHSTASISQTPGNHSVGGLVGYNSGTITDCYSTGDVSGDWGVGGLVGKNSGMTANCYSTASVTGAWWVGGLVGGNMGDGLITNSYSIGSVSGGIDVGGLAGGNIRGYITNSYSTVSVTGASGVGGLVGHNHEGTITACYSTGSVSGTVGPVGGLVGFVRYGEIIYSFWDTETSGLSESAGGTPKTTAEMKTKSTFTEAGWDFVNIWDICEGTNYPRLRWQILEADFLCPYGVDFVDFAVLASAWQTEPNEANWRPGCDISEPKDNFIDELDLSIFCENWLAPP